MLDKPFLFGVATLTVRQLHLLAVLLEGRFRPLPTMGRHLKRAWLASMLDSAEQLIAMADLPTQKAGPRVHVVSLTRPPPRPTSHETPWRIM